MEFSYGHVFYAHTKSSCYAEHSSLYQFKTADFNVESKWVFFPHIAKKKTNWILIHHESLDVTILHFDIKMVHM